MRATPRRSRWGAALFAVFVAFLGAVPGAASADLEGFQWYRTESQGDPDPGWYPTDIDPQAARPDDGRIEGWSFMKPPKGEPPPGPDEQAAFFNEVCGKTKAQPDKKRIGVVVDFSSQVEDKALPKAPKDLIKCAVVAEDATAMDALLAVAKPLVNEDGKVCAINDYPESQCGTLAKTSAEAGTSTLYIVGGALILVIIVGGGFWVIRGWGS